MDAPYVTVQMSEEEAQKRFNEIELLHDAVIKTYYAALPKTLWYTIMDALIVEQEICRLLLEPEEGSDNH